jgi:hypothetical protein
MAWGQGRCKLTVHSFYSHSLRLECGSGKSTCLAYTRPWVPSPPPEKSKNKPKKGERYQQEKDTCCDINHWKRKKKGLVLGKCWAPAHWLTLGFHVLPRYPRQPGVQLNGQGTRDPAKGTEATERSVGTGGRSPEMIWAHREDRHLAEPYTGTQLQLEGEAWGCGSFVRMWHLKAG